MNIAELAKIVGKIATFPINGLHFNVVIVNARQVFGRTDVQITPCAEDGIKLNSTCSWVALDSINFKA